LVEQKQQPLNKVWQGWWTGLSSIRTLAGGGSYVMLQL
jgi:hypothetical protein